MPLILSENPTSVNVIHLAHIMYDEDVSQVDHKGCITMKCFLSGTSQGMTEGSAKDLPRPNKEPGKESVRLLVIGSRQGITNVIQTLHVLGFAEVGAWSPYLPGPHPGEIMSILTISFPVE
jgi:hypothetical protein